MTRMHGWDRISFNHSNRQYFQTRIALGIALMCMWILLPLVAGCGSSESVVSGSVTYDGQAVQKGSILFQPLDGEGSSCGGPIVDGHYEIETTPGKKVVQVVAVKAVIYARRSPEEELRLAQEAAARGDASGVIDRADLIAPDAEGNNAKVDVQAGQQTLDFHLKRPVAKSAS